MRITGFRPAQFPPPASQVMAVTAKQIQWGSKKTSKKKVHRMHDGCSDNWHAYNAHILSVCEAFGKNHWAV